MPLTVTLTGLDGALRTLTTLQSRLDNLVPPLTATREIALASVRRNFQAGGRPQRWAPLKYRRGRPLLDTGRLQGSITGQVTGNSVVIGTNLAYAALHNFGGRIQIPEMRAQRGRAFRFTTQTGEVIFRTRIRAHTVLIPQREFLLLQEQDIADIIRVFEKYVLSTTA